MYLSRSSRRGNNQQVNHMHNGQSSSFPSSAAVSGNSTKTQHTSGSSRTAFQPYRRKSAPSQTRKRPRRKGIWVQNLNLAGFKPEEIEVKTKSKGVTVHAKSREECCDGTIYLAEVSRYFTLPDDVRATDIRCVLSEDGRLTLKAPVRYHAQRAIHGASIILQLNVNKRSRTESNSDHTVDGIKTKIKLTEQVRDSQHENVVENTEKSDESDSATGEDSSPEESIDENDEVTREDEAAITKFKNAKNLEDVIQTRNDLEGENERIEKLDDQGGKDTEKTVSKLGNIKMHSSYDAESSSHADLVLEIDIRNISPDKLRLKCKNNIMFIHAEEERLDGETFSRHELHRKVHLPENALVDRAQAKVDSISGKLKIAVPVAGDKTKTAS